MRWVLTTFLFLALLTNTGAADAMSLSQAMASAYATSPRLQAARAGLRETDEQVPSALAGWRPRLTARSSTDYARDLGATGSNSSVNTSQTIDLEQPIYGGGAVGATLKSAEAEVLAERARLSLVEQSVLRDAVSSFVDLALATHLAELARASEERLGMLLDGARQRFRLGDITQTDVAQAESRLAGARSERQQAEGEIEVARAEFLRTTGEDVRALAVPAALPDLPASLEQALERTQEHPAVVLAEHEVAHARADVEVARSALKPRLSVNAHAGYVDTMSQSAGASAGVGALLTVPLYQGGGEYAALRANKHAVSRAEHAVDSARREVRRDVVAAWETLQAARARSSSLAQQARAAQLALDGVREEARIGARSTLDVLDAESELIAAQAALARDRAQEVTAAFGLLAATGRLNAQNLELAVATYEPREHYQRVRGKWIGLGAAMSDEN